MDSKRVNKDLPFGLDITNVIELSMSVLSMTRVACRLTLLSLFYALCKATLFFYCG